MRWLIFSASFASMFAFLFTLQSSPPVIPDIMREFGISHGEVSSVMTLVAIPGIFLSIPGAIFVDKYGSKKTGSIGLFLITLGSLIGFFSKTFFVLDISRFIVGIGGAIIVVLRHQYSQNIFQPMNSDL